MTAQTVHGGDVLVSARRGAPRHHRTMWLLVVLVAMAIAAASAVYVAVNHSSSAAVSRVVNESPNANTRESRLPVSPASEPNANTREGRVTTRSANEPNANAREGRVPASPGS
jgi:CDP-diacylglycerol pyrophosphatase